MKHLPWLLALMIGSLGMGVTAAASPLVLPLLTATVEASPPPWAPAKGERARGYSRYRFYPSLEMYFDLDRHVWFVFDVASGEWVMTVRRPWTVMFRFPSFIEIDIRSDRPYVYHTMIYGRYAPPGRRTIVVERRREGRSGSRDRDRSDAVYRDRGGDRPKAQESWRDGDKGKPDTREKGKGKDKEKGKDRGHRH